MVLKAFEIQYLSKIKYSCPVGQYFALCLIDYVFLECRLIQLYWSQSWKL